MATRRSYHDNCGMAHALDLIGERWSLLIVRELLFGPKRFGDLKSDLPGISSNVLTDRLAELEQSGVLRRATLPPPAAVRVYELTEWGSELEAVVRVIGRWGARSPHLPMDHHLSAGSAIMSLRTNFDPDLARDLTLEVGIRLGQRTFTAQIDKGTLTAQGATTEEVDVADLVITTEPAVLAGMLYGGLPAKDALADERVTIKGRRSDLTKFLGVFHLPPMAAAG